MQEEDEKEVETLFLEEQRDFSVRIFPSLSKTYRSGLSYEKGKPSVLLRVKTFPTDIEIKACCLFTVIKSTHVLHTTNYTGAIYCLWTWSLRAVQLRDRNLLKEGLIASWWKCENPMFKEYRRVANYRCNDTRFIFRVWRHWCMGAIITVTKES